jgi:hypothetical protein
MVVRDYLAKNFRLDDSRLKTYGAGETSKDDSSQVEILVYGPTVAAPDGKGQAKPAKKAP